MYVRTCILTLYIHVAYVVLHATECHVQLHKIAVACVSMQLNFSCKGQLQNPKFLVMNSHLSKR
jgi:hypothetical protein